MSLAYTGDQWAVLVVVLALGLALKGVIVSWLYRDVRAAGRDVWPWTVGAIIADIPTLIMWHAARPRPAAPPPRAPPPVPPRETEWDDPFQVGLQAPVAAAAPAPDAVREAMIAPIRLVCPRCRTPFTAAREGAGPTRVACPSCGASGNV